MSTFEKWLEKNKLSQSEAAALIGTVPSHISRLLSGRRKPGLRMALLIEKATGGSVPASSWSKPPRRSAA